MPVAQSIIRDEHRSLAAVLHGLAFLVAEIQARRAVPDFRLLEAMLRYVEEFPEKLHHPKEDRHLFRALRERDPGAAALLAELEEEHARGRGLLADLSGALARYRAGAGVASFAVALDAYARFHWEHMRKEEDVLLPRAERALTGEDWQEVDAAFQANADPLAAVDKRALRELFRTIAHLAPPPIGVGPARRAPGEEGG
ncbi:MAG TPA: hemerythrin domain-containing protein [Anaeromyxobacteraceae bacterium]|nr:hemerythrin domain-containing protein [Anaeromyxobacteraceae bacterium]